MARRQRLVALQGWIVSPRFVVAAAIGIAFVLLAMSQLSSLHRGMHVSGDPAYVTADLDHVFHRGPDARQAEDVLRVWRGYEEATAQYTGAHPTATPFEVVRWFVLIDSFLLVPLYCSGLIVLMLLARRRIALWKSKNAPNAERLVAHADQTGIDQQELLQLHRWAVDFSIAFIVLAAVFDELENLGYWTLAKFGSANAPPYTSTAFRWRVDFLWVAAVAKWFFALLAVVLALGVLWQFLVEWLAPKRDLTDDERRARRALWRARVELTIVQAILVVVFGVALLAHEQLADLIRRWTVRQFGITALVVAAFALLAWVIARRLLVHGQWEPAWAGDDGARRRVRLILFWIVIGAAALQIVLDRATAGHERRVGWGLIVPALALLLIAALGFFLRDQPEPKLATPLDPQASTHAPLPRLLAAATIVLFAFGIFNALFGFAVFERAWTWWALLPVVCAVVGGSLTKFVGDRSPLWGVVGGIVVATVVLSIPGEQANDPSIIIAIAVMLPWVGWRLYRDLRDAPELRDAVVPWVVGGLAVIVLLASAAIVVWPIDIAQAVGVVAILAAFMFAVAGVAGVIVWAARAVPVPRALVALHFSRFPLVAFLVVWFVVAAAADSGGYHDIRVEQTAAPTRTTNLPQAFDCWLVKNGLATSACPGVDAAEPAPAARGAVPLFLVSSTGGGIRAAFWTALVLDCAFEVDASDVVSGTPCVGVRSQNFDRSNQLFALSGISGGSVGLATYAAHLVEKAESSAPEPWLERRLSVDGLSPTGLWWLFVELPRVFFQFQTERDRSQLLEESWEREWPERELATGMFALWREHQQVPLLLLNGTSVEDGCRFNGSVLNASIEGRGRTACRSLEPFDEEQKAELGVHVGVNPTSILPATRDLADFVCGSNDAPLSSVAFLSARFPFVNPSGRVSSACPRTTGQVSYVVDGGYLDTSGASPLNELSQTLLPLIDRWNQRREGARCVVPFFVQIDNGFEDAGSDLAPRRPSELTLPLSTVFATRIARAAEARADSALVFNSVFTGARLNGHRLTDRYAHFVNQAHPGPRAPLGWAQSKASEDELRDQFRQRKNLEALREVRGWVRAARNGALSCAG